MTPNSPLGLWDGQIEGRAVRVSGHLYVTQISGGGQLRGGGGKWGWVGGQGKLPRVGQGFYSTKKAKVRHPKKKRKKAHTSFKMGSMAMPSPQKVLALENDLNHVFFQRKGREVFFRTNQKRLYFVETQKKGKSLVPKGQMVFL